MANNWSVYKIFPIDHGWHYLKTVSETARIIGGNWAEAEINGLVADQPNVEEFLESYHIALETAVAAGYDGIKRNDPVVFWLPDQLVFSYGFVFKSDNGGVTFVVSPKALPWADRLVKS